MLSHTFVIAAYKESKYLETCILSLLGQEVKSQLIIVTSTPNMFIQQLADKYELIYIINNTIEKGIAGDWNFALQAAHTKLVTIVHQDDIYEADYLATMLDSFNQSKRKILIAFSDYTEILNHKIRLHSLNFLVKKILLFPFLFSKSISSTFLKKFILAFGDPICCPSVTFNKSLIEGFEFSSDFKCALDWYAWYELAKKDGAFLFVNKKLVQHRIHQGSATTENLDTGVRQQEERKILNKIWGTRVGGYISRLYSLGHKSNYID